MGGFSSITRFDGSIDIDMRLDVYTLGKLLYELIAGGPPISSERIIRKTESLRVPRVRLIKPEARSGGKSKVF